LAKRALLELKVHDGNILMCLEMVTQILQQRSTMITLQKEEPSFFGIASDPTKVPSHVVVDRHVKMMVFKLISKFGLTKIREVYTIHEIGLSPIIFELVNESMNWKCDGFEK